MKFSVCEFLRPVDGDKEIEQPFVSSGFGKVDMYVTNWIAALLQSSRCSAICVTTRGWIGSEISRRETEAILSSAQHRETRVARGHAACNKSLDGMTPAILPTWQTAEGSGTTKCKMARKKPRHFLRLKRQKNGAFYCLNVACQ